MQTKENTATDPLQTHINRKRTGHKQKTQRSQQATSYSHACAKINTLKHIWYSKTTQKIRIAGKSNGNLPLERYIWLWHTGPTWPHTPIFNRLNIWKAAINGNPSTQTPNNTIKYQKYIAKHRETHGQAAAVKTHTHSHLTREMSPRQGTGQSGRDETKERDELHGRGPSPLVGFSYGRRGRGFSYPADMTQWLSVLS